MKLPTTHRIYPIQSDCAIFAVSIFQFSRAYSLLEPYVKIIAGFQHPTLQTLFIGLQSLCTAS